MHFVVCIKQVPDSAQIRVHPVTNTIMRQGVPTIINPYDLFALEEALRLRDKLGGEVTVLTMGPPMAEDALRKALTFGADRAVLLTDRFFAGSDTLATSYALAQAIRKIGETWGAPDIVFTGKQTIDGDTAQVGPGIARRLGLNAAHLCRRRSSTLDPARAHHRGSSGAPKAACRCCASRLPCLITHAGGSNEIRRGRIADALRAARAEIVTWNAAGRRASRTSAKCGLRGSPTVVKRVFAPHAARREGRIDRSRRMPADTAEALIAAHFQAPSPALEAELDGTAARILRKERADMFDERHQHRSPPAAASSRAAMKKELPEHFKAYKHVWVFVEHGARPGPPGLARS